MKRNPGIYCLRNKVNGKEYWGKDTYLPSRPDCHLKGKRKNCRLIYNAIQKYGRDNFEVEIILYPGISREALYAVEQWKIAQRCTNASKGGHGYNLTDGGMGNVGMRHSESFNQKVSERQKGKNNSFYGKKHTPETRQRMSRAHLGRKNTPEATKKTADALRGRKLTAEHRRKVSENHADVSGENNPNHRVNRQKRSGAIQLELFDKSKASKKKR